jgi:hypothetical protein
MPKPKGGRGMHIFEHGHANHADEEAKSWRCYLEESGIKIINKAGKRQGKGREKGREMYVGPGQGRQGRRIPC